MGGDLYRLQSCTPSQGTQNSSAQGLANRKAIGKHHTRSGRTLHRRSLVRHARARILCKPTWQRGLSKGRYANGRNFRVWEAGAEGRTGAADSSECELAMPDRKGVPRREAGSADQAPSVYEVAGKSHYDLGSSSRRMKKSRRHVLHGMHAARGQSLCPGCHGPIAPTAGAVRQCRAGARTPPLYTWGPIGPGDVQHS